MQMSTRANILPWFKFGTILASFGLAYDKDWHRITLGGAQKNYYIFQILNFCGRDYI